MNSLSATSKRRPTAAREDIPLELFAEWVERRLRPNPDSYRTLAKEATVKLGIPIRDDSISRWLKGTPAGSVEARSKSNTPSAAPKVDLRSDPKPAGHPVTWLSLMSATPSLWGADGQPPAFVLPGSISYGFAK